LIVVVLFAFVPAFLLDSANGAAYLHRPLAIGRSIRFCYHFACLSVGELFAGNHFVCLSIGELFAGIHLVCLSIGELFAAIHFDVRRAQLNEIGYRVMNGL